MLPLVRGHAAAGRDRRAGRRTTPAQATGTVPGHRRIVVAGDTNLVLYATDTPTPSPTPTQRPATPTPDRVDRAETATAQPTPYVVIKPATLNGHRGPGTEYERVGQAKKGQELFVLGRTADGAWLQVCCMANQPVWVAADQVDAQGAVQTAAVLTPAARAAADAHPAPGGRRAPRTGPEPAGHAAPVGTPLPPFDIARGRSSRWPATTASDIWVKV